MKIFTRLPQSDRRSLKMELRRTIEYLLAITLCAQFLTSNASAQYPALPVPPTYAGPSNEPGQIMLDGIVRKIALFHGGAELDWHVYIDLHPDVTRDLYNQLRGTHRFFDDPDCQLDEDCGLDNIYSEIMVVDEKRPLGNPLVPGTAVPDSFLSADFSTAFRLQSLILPPSRSVLSKDRFELCKSLSIFSRHTGIHPALDLGLIAACDKGDSHDLSRFSELVSCPLSRVYLQGAFVEDAEHRKCKPLPPPGFCPLASLDKVTITRPEIHPLDSIAFAMREDGTVLSAKLGDEGWPSTVVRWRVAVFANSGYHRINDEDYVKRNRTTTWYLPLPQEAYSGWDEQNIRPVVEEQKHDLFDSKRNETFNDRGIASYSHRLETDPRDGRKKLVITATMTRPNDRGGIVVRDYLIRIQLHSYPDVCIRNAKTGYGDCQFAPWATVDQNVDAGATATYYIRGQTQGPTPIQFDIRSFPSGGSWIVKFFDAKVGGNDITSLVTSAAGWRSPLIQGGQSTQEIRLEVTPGRRLRPGVKKEVVVQAQSSVDPAKVDYVKAVTTVAPRLP